MRQTIILSTLFTSLSLAAAISPLSLINSLRFREQNPMAAPPAVDDNADSSLSISDILPQTRRINIFASLTRDVASVTSRLESLSAADNTTLLAPLNSAMQELPRKPWEDRPDDADRVEGESTEDRAAKNLARFVEEHVVTRSPWVEGEKVRTLGGQELWWEKRGDDRVVMPGNLLVDGVVGRVGNGEVWAVKGVVNYQ